MKPILKEMYLKVDYIILQGRRVKDRAKASYEVCIPDGTVLIIRKPQFHKFQVDTYGNEASTGVDVKGFTSGDKLC